MEQMPDNFMLCHSAFAVIPLKCRPSAKSRYQKKKKKVCSETCMSHTQPRHVNPSPTLHEAQDSSNISLNKEDCRGILVT